LYSVFSCDNGNICQPSNKAADSSQPDHKH
jgi:hypothetical protein